MTVKKPRNLYTNVIPQYYEMLSENEQQEYSRLRQQLSLPGCKNRRNKSNETFQEMLQAIKAFVVRNDQRDINRALVCGIIWLDDGGIAINTHQLSLLTNKCKSSINGSFQSLQYGTNPTGTESSTDITSKFPFMKNNFAQLRQWTIRKPIANQSTKIQQPLCEIVKKKIAGEEDITPPEDLRPMLEQEHTLSLCDIVQNLIKKSAEKGAAPPAASTMTEDTDFFPIPLKLTDDFLDFYSTS